MNQRMYFLFPDRQHALSAVNELVQNGYRHEHMHALANSQVSLEGLPVNADRQTGDRARYLEFWGWRVNLALFFIAAGALLVMAVVRPAWGWWLLALAVMAATLFLGERFSHLPNVHNDAFREALAHGEILLMVDVPPERVHEVAYRVQRHHPEAVAGGASWNLPALGT